MFEKLIEKKNYCEIKAREFYLKGDTSMMNFYTKAGKTFEKKAMKLTLENAK